MTNGAFGTEPMGRQQPEATDSTPGSARMRSTLASTRRARPAVFRYWSPVREICKVRTFVRVKAGLDRPHGNKTSNQQAGTDQQDKRQRYFAHDQERASLGFSRHGAHIAARGLKRGNQAEQNACGERQKQREADDSPVGGDAGLAHARDIADIQSQKRADSGDAEDQPKDSSGEREDDAFGEQLTDEAGAPRRSQKSR